MAAIPQRHPLRVLFLGLLALALAACTDPGSSLAAPTEVTAAAHPGFNRLTWQHPGDGVTGFALYRALRTEDAPAFAELATVAADARSFDDRGITVGSAYLYAVAALSAQGASPRSQATAAVTALAPHSVTAGDLELETDEDTAVRVTLTASHSGGEALSFTVTSAPAHGTLSGAAPALTYTPDADWFGTDAFEFEAADAQGAKATATVTITVRPVYDAPVIETFTVDRGNVKFGEPVTFTWNVRHVDGTPLTCRLDTGAAVHELGDCAGAGSQFHLYPNVNGGFAARLVVDDGTTALESGEVAVAVTRRATPLSGDNSFSVGVKEDGSVVAWGGGSAQLRNVPADLTDVVAVATRWNHILALDSGGTVTYWGYGNGDRGTLDYLPPLVGMAATQQHALGVTADGQVVAWGAGTIHNETDVPADLGFVVAVAASHTQSLALLADGTVVGWGQDNWGQVTAPEDLTDVVGIATGSLFSAALKADGTVVAWGVPDGRTSVPAGVTGVTAIATGDFHTLALRTDGTVVGWGMAGANDKGQFTVPDGVTDIVAIAGARSHSLALTADGKAVGWGDDTYGQAGPPESDDTLMLP